MEVTGRQAPRLRRDRWHAMALAAFVKNWEFGIRTSVCVFVTYTPHAVKQSPLQQGVVFAMSHDCLSQPWSGVTVVASGGHFSRRHLQILSRGDQEPGAATREAAPRSCEPRRAAHLCVAALPPARRLSGEWSRQSTTCTRWDMALGHLSSRHGARVQGGSEDTARFKNP